MLLEADGAAVAPAPLIAARAKANQGQRTDLLQDLAKSEPVHTRDEIARSAGVSGETVRKVETILAEAGRIKNEIISLLIPEGLTPGQARWLAALPADQRATFDGLSPGRRAMVLARRPHGELADPMLLRMEAADLTPRRPVAAPRPILTTEDAVHACAGGQRPATAMLAELLAREFDDRKSWPFFDRVGGLLLEDPSRAAGFLDALRQARSPKAQNPGAVLVTALKRDHGW
jgi:hypothetical protein